MKKILALVLCLVMVVSVATLTFAAGVTYTKVTSGELTTGQYVLVDKNGNAPSALNGDWIDVVQPTVADDVVTDAKNAVWTITVNENGVTIKDVNGKFVSPKGTKTNGIKEGEFTWTYTFADGLFTFNGDQVSLASNTSSENRYRAYKQTTIANDPEGYPSQFTLYKLEGGASTPTEAPTEPPVVPTITANKVDALTDGMKIVIYNPGNKVINTNVEYLYEGKNSNKLELKTVAATVEGTVLTAPKADAGILTVKVVDGHYSFVNEAGKYLYMDTSDVKFVDEAGDYTLFDLVSVEGGYYIKSTNAVYSYEKDGEVVTKDQYLEYYSGYYTVYSLNESKADLYLFNFYEVNVKNVDTGDFFGVILVALTVSGMGITAVASKKKH